MFKRKGQVGVGIVVAILLVGILSLLVFAKSQSNPSRIVTYTEAGIPVTVADYTIIRPQSTGISIFSTVPMSSDNDDSSVSTPSPHHSSSSDWGSWGSSSPSSDSSSWGGSSHSSYDSGSWGGSSSYGGSDSGSYSSSSSSSSSDSGSW